MFDLYGSYEKKFRIMVGTNHADDRNEADLNSAKDFIFRMCKKKIPIDEPK